MEHKSIKLKIGNQCGSKQNKKCMCVLFFWKGNYNWQVCIQAKLKKKRKYKLPLLEIKNNHYYAIVFKRIIKI